MEAKQGKGVTPGKSVKTVPPTKYNCPDTEKGFTTNKAEINFLKAENKLDEFNNLLLGSFSESGEYFVDTDIVRELVALRKIELGHDGALVFADSKAKFGIAGKFHFSLQFEKQGEQGIAYLNLMECVERANGYILNTNTYRLAKYTAPLDEGFKAKARRKFNMVTQLEDDEDTDGGQKRIVPTKNIDYRLGFLTLAQRLLEKRQEEIEQEFLMERLAALGAGKNGKLILDAYNAERTKVEKFFLQNKKNKYRSLNEILTRVIDVKQHEGVKLEPDVQQKLEDASNRLKVSTDALTKDIDAHAGKKPQEQDPALKTPNQAKAQEEAKQGPKRGTSSSQFAIDPFKAESPSDKTAEIADQESGQTDGAKELDDDAYENDGVGEKGEQKQDEAKADEQAEKNPVDFSATAEGLAEEGSVKRREEDVIGKGKEIGQTKEIGRTSEKVGDKPGPKNDGGSMVL